MYWIVYGVRYDLCKEELKVFMKPSVAYTLLMLQKHHPDTADLYRAIEKTIEKLKKKLWELAVEKSAHFDLSTEGIEVLCEIEMLGDELVKMLGGALKNLEVCKQEEEKQPEEEKSQPSFVAMLNNCRNSQNIKQIER